MMFRHAITHRDVRVSVHCWKRNIFVNKGVVGVYCSTVCVCVCVSLVVAQIDDLELLHVSHLLRQRLQFIGVQKQHSDVLPAAHLSQTHTREFKS